ncbi:MAG: S8 family serine peptidase, partial [Anaerolineales bacterium]|nr:S8 family serine peptidase [Anaerolineales bacterium]
GVYSVQPAPTDGGLRGEMSDQINVNNHDGSNAAFPGYAAWLAAAGVDGSGVIIANVDGGIQDTHPDLSNRMVSCTGDTCGGGASSSHGTHTAGIMAADGTSGTVDGNGFLRGLGMAPGANLVEQVYSPWYLQAGGMLKLITDSYANNALLSGNSWGPSGSPLGYDDDTLQVDIGVRDADTVAAGNQEFTYVLSFMNGNGGTSTQGTPDEAKNIFTIGSTKMQLSNGNQDLNINDISANSAHGPALDGRTIPHMVAPGCRVDSTVPTNSYGLNCGTSMASPHVTGAVALFIEYYRDLFASDPSPALVKAAFLPVAHDLAGFDDADGGTLGHPFDSKQGWGRMDAAAVVSPTVSIVYVDQTTILDNTGEEWTATFGVADPSQPVRLMLVWTDAPGHGLGGSTPAWNNDLNLTVTANGNDYIGNNFGVDGWSQTGGSFDGMNNTEGVFLASASGSLTITVAGGNINSDGVPGVGDGTDQDFAIVCYNCVEAPIEYTEFVYLPIVANRP